RSAAAELSEYLGHGGGLVVSGISANDSAPVILDLAGYDSAMSSTGVINASYGMRMVDSTHPITRGMDAGTVFITGTSNGSSTISSAPIRGMILAEQLVALDGNTASPASTCPIPGIIVNTDGDYDGNEKAGRIVYFNFDSAITGMMSLLMERALQWAG